jgi:hypothetical protein
MKQHDLTTLTEIIDRFDFEKVHAYMKLTKWHWAGSPEAPSIDEMKRTVCSLFYALQDRPRDNNKCSTGGFVLSYFTWDSGIEYNLTFSLETVYLSGPLEEK